MKTYFETNPPSDLEWKYLQLGVGEWLKHTAPESYRKNFFVSPGFVQCLWRSVWNWRIDSKKRKQILEVGQEIYKNRQKTALESI